MRTSSTGNLHWGVYEGMCTEDGKTDGLGRWICTHPHPSDPEDKGVSFAGCFKNDLSEGFSEFS